MIDPVPVPRTAVIVQSSYIPWKGYFDLIRRADCFILYDDAQYTQRDWRSRNRIKTKDGLQWLTIPIAHPARTQRIRDTRIADATWNRRHWRAIASAYARAAYFAQYRDALEDLYGQMTTPWLSEINRGFIEAICRWFGITTPLTWSSDYTLAAGQSARLVDLCRQLGATHYLSGPTARGYLDVSLFDQAGMTVSFMDYSGYPVYTQVHPPFEHAVSAVDLLLNAGPAAPQYFLPL